MRLIDGSYNKRVLIVTIITNIIDAALTINSIETVVKAVKWSTIKEFCEMCLMVLGTKNFETIRKSSIGIDRAEREGCLLPERQEDGSRRKQKIIFYMKGWLQNVKTKYL